tara:strand:+ start:941 stop:1933 length:993 start_codon:yes stop_codon:yes gene_type:complete
MNIVITGVAGLLGSHLSRHLLSQGHNVYGIDDFSGGYEDFLVEHQNFTFYERCLGADSIYDIFEETKIDCVFHFAAYAAEGLSPFVRHFNYQNNLIASVDVINECIKHNAKLIFTSSMAVYGGQKPPFDERMETQPIDPYGIAKATVEKDIMQAAEQFGLKYNIVRPHNVLGVYQNIWDKYRNVIGIFIRRTLNDQPILVYGDGEQTRAFSDISFYMEPFEKLTTSLDGEIFNIGADKYWSINEIASLVVDTAKKYGIKASIEHKEPRHEVKHAFCDHTKAKELLDFKDETNIIILIEKVFEWAKTQPDRQVKLMDYEIEKGIYSFWKDK